LPHVAWLTTPVVLLLVMVTLGVVWTVPPDEQAKLLHHLRNVSESDGLSLLGLVLFLRADMVLVV
jgi:hypothetical protein